MILLEVNKNEREESERFIEQIDNVEIIESKNMMSNGEVIQFVIPLAASTASVIIAWIKAYYAAKKEITVKYKGIEVRGFNEHTAESIIKDLLEKEKAEENEDQDEK